MQCFWMKTLALQFDLVQVIYSHDDTVASGDNSQLTNDMSVDLLMITELAVDSCTLR